MIRKLLVTALLCAAATPVLAAAQCSVDIEANDAMQFNKKSIDVGKSCKQFTVNLKHVGKMPKTAMGHNWVLTAKADEQAVISDGSKAGPAADYIKAGDARVIAHTKLIGGGESATATIPVAKLKAGTDYAFFCSFPGHAAMMKGTLKLN